MVRWHQGNTSKEIPCERLRGEVMGWGLEYTAGAKPPSVTDAS